MNWEQDPWMNPEFRMARKSQQRDWRSGRKRILTILGITIGIYAIYLIVGGEFGLWRLLALQKQEVRLAGEIAEAQGRVDLLKRDLQNIAETREREAREGFGMARSNEVIYEIVPQDSALSGMPGGEPGAVISGTEQLGGVPAAPKPAPREEVSKSGSHAAKKTPVKAKSVQGTNKPPAKATKQHPPKKGR
jgi:cell division protein FtsB